MIINHFWIERATGPSALRGAIFVCTKFAHETYPLMYLVENGTKISPLTFGFSSRMPIATLSTTKRVDIFFPIILNINNRQLRILESNRRYNMHSLDLVTMRKMVPGVYKFTPGPVRGMRDYCFSLISGVGETRWPR